MFSQCMQYSLHLSWPCMQKIVVVNFSGHLGLIAIHDQLCVGARLRTLCIYAGHNNMGVFAENRKVHLFFCTLINQHIPYHTSETLSFMHPQYLQLSYFVCVHMHMCVYMCFM